MSQASELITQQLLSAMSVNAVWGGIIINVKAHPFNAKGDGETDDTLAIQAAIDYAIYIGKHEVTFPSGTYLYGTLLNTSGITFIGDGVTLNGTTPITMTSLATLKADTTQRGINVQSAPYNAKGDGTDDTVAFTAALTAAVGGVLFIPKQSGSYYLVGQLLIPSNITIIMQSGTVIRAKDTLSQVSPYERLFVMRDVSNVIIHGNNGALEYNKAAYSGEQNHCVDMSGATNVEIHNLICRNSGGDGIYVGKNLSTKLYCENIRLYNCVMDNNRRQGLSITAADDFYAENCIFKNTIGTNPEAGVDIEDNGETEIMRKIRFYNCHSINNNGEGFVTFLKTRTANSDPVDVIFDKCSTNGNTYGFATKYAVDGGKGEVKYLDCVAKDAKLSGFLDVSCSASSVKKKYVRCRAINCNTTAATATTNSFASSFLIHDFSGEIRSTIGNTEYHQCESIDDRITPLISRGFAQTNPSAAVPQKIRYFNCNSIGSSVSEFENDADGQDIYVENTPKKTSVKTATGSLSLRELGYEVLNTGATGNVTMTLPAAKDGFTYKFRVTTAQNFKIKPSTGKQILTTAGIDLSLQSATLGCTLELKGLSDGNWEIVRRIGTWTEV